MAYALLTAIALFGAVFFAVKRFNSFDRVNRRREKREVVAYHARKP